MGSGPSALGAATAPGGSRVVGEEPNATVGSSRIHRRTITGDYRFESKILGTGFSGPVRLATNKATGQRCAVKKYDKRAADAERIEFLKQEAQVYLLLDHPNVCKLFALYEDDRYVWVVMEYCEGPELYRQLHAAGRYTEAHANAVTQQIVAAIHYLHSHNIVHRDLKMENWLYEACDGDVTGRLKLIDFGFSQVWNRARSARMRQSCGSLTYVAPDVLRGEYTNACDMWALGVTVHFLLVGMPPFFGPRESVVVARILRGDYALEGARWAAVTAEAKDFVRRLLAVDPAARMTSGQALAHPWLNAARPSVERPLALDVLSSLRDFAVATHLKRAVLTMMAYSLTTKEIGQLADVFKQFDRNQDGCISLPDFMAAMQAHYAISNTEVEELFTAAATIKNYDADDPERPVPEICYSDFVAATLKTRLELHAVTARAVFRQLDADNSGFVTADDLQKVLGEAFGGASCVDLIKSADRNRDGKIDFEEFWAALMESAPDEDEGVGVVGLPTAAAAGEEGAAPAPAAAATAGATERFPLSPGPGDTAAAPAVAYTPSASHTRQAKLVNRFLRVLEAREGPNEASKRLMRRTQSVPHFNGSGSWNSPPHAQAWDCRMHEASDGAGAPTAPMMHALSVDLRFAPAAAAGGAAGGAGAAGAGAGSGGSSGGGASGAPPPPPAAPPSPPSPPSAPPPAGLSTASSRRANSKDLTTSFSVGGAESAGAPDGASPAAYYDDSIDVESTESIG